MSPRPPSVDAAMLGRIEASIMAESAVVDKETGRVYWEGGDSSTLSASLYPKIGVPGFSHLKATVLTSLLLLALVSFLAQWVRKRMNHSNTVQPTEIKASFYQSAAVFLLHWTLLKTPNFDRTFVICVFLLYLIESFNCSTRRYLKNAITSSQEVEEYIEELRNQAPVVTWKVRCFHYERPYWLTPWKLVQAIFQNNQQKKVEEDSMDTPIVQKDHDNISGPFRRKVVNHQATASYTFGRFDDATIAGVWRRQTAISKQAAPFMKIVLSKILVLANQDAKNDYFKQQSKFVTSEGMRDRYAEYSTNIEVPGFKRRMLAVRPVEGVPSAKLFRLTTFWIFTLLGLTVPYRIWFARHADKLRVTVVKETHAQVTERSSSSFSSWFTSSSKQQQSSALPSQRQSEEIFRQQMQALLLYAQQEKVVQQQQQQSTITAPLATTTDDSKPAPKERGDEGHSANKAATNTATSEEKNTATNKSASKALVPSAARDATTAPSKGSIPSALDHSQTTPEKEERVGHQ